MNVTILIKSVLTIITATEEVFVVEEIPVNVLYHIMEAFVQKLKTLVSDLIAEMEEFVLEMVIVLAWILVIVIQIIMVLYAMRRLVIQLLAQQYHA